jgi:hypothetical protein
MYGLIGVANAKKIAKTKFPQKMKRYGLTNEKTLESKANLNIFLAGCSDISPQSYTHFYVFS